VTLKWVYVCETGVVFINGTVRMRVVTLPLRPHTIDANSWRAHSTSIAVKQTTDKTVGSPCSLYVWSIIWDLMPTKHWTYTSLTELDKVTATSKAPQGGLKWDIACSPVLLKHKNIIYTNLFCIRKITSYVWSTIAITHSYFFNAFHYRHININHPENEKQIDQEDDGERHNTRGWNRRFS
jgi:hypothetical protein